ncbi:MAG: hypothetical protein M3N47_11960 [Chloroflexota bacterium]|nr:hypothetical protein [Chloroflexota bacterium]
MPDKIEMTKSGFVSVLASVASPCGPGLPGEEPIEGWIDPDPEQCDHWLQMVTIIRAADVAIGRTLGQQRLGETLAAGGTEAVLVSNRSDLQRFADDCCESPPRWPLPWPPPRRPLDANGLTPAQLLVAGARFQAAADHIGDNALQPELAAVADRFFETGLSRLNEPRSDTTGARLRGACGTMERLIRVVEREIAANGRRIDDLTERITELQSQPNPDLVQIQALEALVQELQDAVAQDRRDLDVLEEEFQASCGPR